MDVLPENFRTLFRCGVWYEDEKSDSFPKMVYRIFVVVVMYYVTMMEVLELLNPSNVYDLTECLFLSLSYVSTCMKWMNFALRRDEMLGLLNEFRSKICQPRSIDEEEILNKTTRKAARLHNFLINMAAFCAAFFVIRPLTKIGHSQLELPIKTYQLYDTSNTVYFCFSYVIQSIAEFYAAVIALAFDTLAYSFMNLLSAQFELCAYRITNSIEAGKTMTAIDDLIAHHTFLLNTVKKIESFFIGVIAPFFITCLITLCTSIFQIQQKNLASVEFFTLLVYLVCLLFEAFLYCWNGNELKLKCQSIVAAAYDSNWTSLTPQEQKNILLIMQIGQKSTTISCRGQFVLSTDTFAWILKTSYAAFNLLSGVAGTKNDD